MPLTTDERYERCDELFDECEETAEAYLDALIAKAREECDEDELRRLCLFQLLRVDNQERVILCEVSPSTWDGTRFDVGRAEYLVLDEDEANDAWDESLDNYLDECVLCELDGIAETYFDREAWKRDARHDGRGHSLSSYDGCEMDAQEYCVFRIN